MAATQGVSAFGTDVQIYYSAAWNSVPEPKDISGPNITSEFIDFTHHSSPAGFRERKPSFKSSGDVTFKTNYIHSNATHQALVTAAKANPPTLLPCKLIFVDKSVFDFSAYVSLAWTNPLNGPSEMAVTLSITGDVTLAMPSPSVSSSESVSVSASAS
jgi:hypothetical protein